MSPKSESNKHIHLIGIGGAGMSAIARVLLERGFVVSGSDRERSQVTLELEMLGATIYEGHQADQITGANLVIRSSAVPDDNVEMAAARKANIPALKRADFLGSMMAEQIGIAIAGTHGKTTTTGMIAHILLKCKAEPTIIVGGQLPTIQSNGKSGTGHHFVVEADEYDRMFLGLRPKVAVITNVEHDHPDIYPSEESYVEAFEQFISKLPPKGRLIVCGEDSAAVELVAKSRDSLQRVLYGSEIKHPPKGVNTVIAKNISGNQYGGHDFMVELNGKKLGPARLRIPGYHNVLNALAAIATVLFEGIGYKHISHSLASFSGMGRRFEVKGQVNGVTIVDDYAHHPTEIRATLAAARQRYGAQRLWAVWQPHTYSRLKLLKDEFADCFEEADRVLVLDIYRSRESDSQGIDIEEFVKGLSHPDATHIAQMVKATTYLTDTAESGDVIIIMNAGDARLLADWTLDGLRERTAGSFITQTGSLKDKLPMLENSSNHEDEEMRATVDATAEQVRRLVAKLQEKQKQSGSKE